MFSVAITEFSQIGEARRLVTRLMHELKFSENEIAKAAIIVTESATNLVKHTDKGGEIIIENACEDDQPLINIWAIDRGPGVANIQRCLSDGYSTRGTAGTGLGAIKRLADTFDIYSQCGVGTLLWAQVKARITSKIFFFASSKQFPLEVAAICLPLQGEQHCGDGWAAYFNPIALTGLYMVVDGLGHGEGAYEVAQEADRIFHLHKNSDLSLPDLMQKFHIALAKTRGAALALAKIYLLDNKLEYVGIGNICGVILTPQKRQSLISLGGIMGHSIRKIQMFSYPLPPSWLFIMHSDGLKTHWNLQDYTNILSKSAAIITGTLYQNYKREKDDTTVLVIKNRLNA